MLPADFAKLTTPQQGVVRLLEAQGQTVTLDRATNKGGLIMVSINPHHRKRFITPGGRITDKLPSRGS